MVAREPATPGPAASSARSFPLNAWYAAAWSHKIKRELTPRTICNKDIVLYRRSDGQVAALAVVADLAQVMPYLPQSGDCTPLV